MLKLAVGIETLVKFKKKDMSTLIKPNTYKLATEGE